MHFAFFTRVKLKNNCPSALVFYAYRKYLYWLDPYAVESKFHWVNHISELASLDKRHYVTLLFSCVVNCRIWSVFNRSRSDLKWLPMTLCKGRVAYWLYLNAVTGTERWRVMPKISSALKDENFFGEKICFGGTCNYSQVTCVEVIVHSHQYDCPCSAFSFTTGSNCLLKNLMATRGSNCR